MSLTAKSERPMQIERMTDEDGGIVTYMARGHVDVAVFTAEVAKRQNCERLPESTWGKAEHTWLRAVPRQGFNRYYIDATPNSRGAFPATMLSSYY